MQKSIQFLVLHLRPQTTTWNMRKLFQKWYNVVVSLQSWGKHSPPCAVWQRKRWCSVDCCDYKCHTICSISESTSVWASYWEKNGACNGKRKPYSHIGSHGQMLLAHTHFHGHLRVTNHHPMKGEKEYQSLIPVIQHLTSFLPSCYTRKTCCLQNKI